MQDGIPFVAAAGWNGNGMATCNFLLYNESRITITDKIEANANYQLDYQGRLITSWSISDDYDSPWKFL